MPELPLFPTSFQRPVMDSRVWAGFERAVPAIDCGDATVVAATTPTKM
jgi:hypothetical protein